MTPVTYKDAGVDIDEGDRFVEAIQGLMKRTFDGRVVDRPGAFAGLFSVAFVRPSFLARLPDLPISFWGAVLFLAWPCTVFAFLVWFGALGRMPAARVAW